MFAGITENPAWQLVSALHSLKDDKRILIPEFYRDVNMPSDEELHKYGLVDLSLQKEQLEEAFGLHITDELKGSDALLEAYYQPTLNINGFYSGYTVPKGMKILIPATARAKIDMRLVPE